MGVTPAPLRFASDPEPFLALGAQELGIALWLFRHRICARIARANAGWFSWSLLLSTNSRRGPKWGLGFAHDEYVGVNASSTLFAAHQSRISRFL